MAGYAEISLVRGMNFLAESQSAIANNLANVDTANYKRRAPVAVESQRVFDQMLGQRMPTVRYGERSDFTQGTMRETGNSMEIALSEGSWLQVQDDKGRTFLTRDGQMQIDKQGRLVTQEGLAYLDQTGNAITVGSGDQAPSQLSFAQNGAISDPTTGQAYGPIGVYRVADQNALRPVGGGKFEDLANQQLQIADGGVQQGYQEGSNVDSLQELVQMIVVQRSFSATQKALSSVGRMQDQLVANISR
jgi:flagellar basal body rod protein FlgG